MSLLFCLFVSHRNTGGGGGSLEDSWSYQNQVQHQVKRTRRKKKISSTCCYKAHGHESLYNVMLSSAIVVELMDVLQRCGRHVVVRHCCKACRCGALCNATSFASLAVVVIGWCSFWSLQLPTIAIDVRRLLFDVRCSQCPSTDIFKKK
jgi:hypothetical protein